MLTETRSTALDLDAMERRARNEAYVLALAGHPGSTAASDALALIARVRELEAEVIAQKAIISTGMSAFRYGRGEGVAAERKRCAEVVRRRVTEDGFLGEWCRHIAEAIEWGE